MAVVIKPRYNGCDKNRCVFLQTLAMLHPKGNVIMSK